MQVVLNKYHEAVVNALAHQLAQFVQDEYETYGASDSDAVPEDDSPAFSEDGCVMHFPKDVDEVANEYHFDGEAILEQFSDEYSDEICYQARRNFDQALELNGRDFEWYDEDGNLISHYDKSGWEWLPSAFEYRLAQTTEVLSWEHDETEELLDQCEADAQL